MGHNETLIKIVDRLAQEEGFSSTLLDSVKVFRASNYVPRQQLSYDACIVIILQGHKIGYWVNESFRYDADNLLVVSAAMPFECETFGTREEPLLAVLVDVKLEKLFQLIGKMKLHKKDAIKPPRVIHSLKIDDRIKAVVVRLIECLQSETEASILGDGYVTELIFRVLQEKVGYSLYAMKKPNSNTSNIFRSLHFIHKNYADGLDVSVLAKRANMSISSFHQHFKAITSYSPIQYVKKFRLNKARELILTNGYRANIAAIEAGYENPSQFSREYKRHFGRTVREDLSMEKGETAFV